MRMRPLKFKMEKTRREELDMWRKRTGRTPMKRLSYVQPCADRPVTPLLNTGARRVATSCKRQTKRVRPHGVLTPLNVIRESNCRTRKGDESGCGLVRLVDSTEKAATKELFQRDIDDTVAEILAYDSSQINRELEFEELTGEKQNQNTSSHITRSSDRPEDMHVSTHKKKRRSSAFYVDLELEFQSSKICYTTTVPGHRRRRSTHSCRQGEDPDRCLLYLTPVKRTTRKSLSTLRPELSVEELCFDSPSQAEGRGYDGVKVLPNAALALSERGRAQKGEN